MRPTNKLRLSTLDPNAFVDEVARRVDALITLLHADRMDANLRHTAQCVIEYAQDGEHILGHDRAHKSISDLIMQLYSSAMSSAEIARVFDDSPYRAEDADPVLLVLLAAVGRYQIAMGQRVRVRHLAALSSVSAAALYAAITRGDLRAKNGTVAAQDAKKWLKGRG